MRKPEDNAREHVVSFLPAGIGIGVAIGATLGNIGVGMTFGAAIGVTLSLLADHLRK